MLELFVSLELALLLAKNHCDKLYNFVLVSYSGRLFIIIDEHVEYVSLIRLVGTVAVCSPAVYRLYFLKILYYCRCHFTILNTSTKVNTLN